MSLRPSPWRGAGAVVLMAAPASAGMLGERHDIVQGTIEVAVAILGAVVVHWLLRRVGRRLPRLLARRSGGPAAPGAPLKWEGVVHFAVLLMMIATWLALGLFATDQFRGLQQARERVTHAAIMGVTSPMFVLNGRGYSAVDLLELPVVLAAVWVAIGGLTGALKVHVLRATHLERGVQEAVALMVRYALVFLGAIVVLQVWGIDASSLTFVASVLGVGIGFGLQHLANNFVSGLVISLERPIQPGDFVKVGEWIGTVERVGPRNTEIRTNDNVSILVPNSRFLETEVVNWSHKDPVCRLHVPVGVAYGSDVGRVRGALLESARGHREVLSDPRARVEFRGFGDSALNFELVVWTRDPRNQLRLISDLNYRIEASLRHHHIGIPFPQRDLHLRSPQLEQVLTAWSRRHFSEAELNCATSADATSRLPEPAGDGANAFDDEPAPRVWSDERIGSVLARLRGPDGVAIFDRRHLLTVYRQCFVGREAVDWMTRTLGLTRAEAVDVGQLLIDRGMVRHVLDEHGFKDGNFFYRFIQDQPVHAGELFARSA